MAPMAAMTRASLCGLRLHDSTNHPVDGAYTDQRAQRGPLAPLAATRAFGRDGPGPSRS
jgi:hypothetical protein